MALNAYNSARHHIGIATRSGTNYGFMLNGGYRMEMQREALGAQDFGGSTDLIGQTPSMARWTQDDFTGGMGQFSWGKDEAMFADCINFMPDMQSRRLLSVPPMYLKWAFDPDTKTGFVSDLAKNMFIVNGKIYVVYGHGIMSQTIESGAGTVTWTGQTDMLADSTETIVNAEYDPNDNRIVILVTDSSSGVGCRIHYRNLALGDPTNVSDAGPTGVQAGYGMAIFGKNLVVQVGNRTWLGTWAADTVTNASSVITWTELGRLPGRWKAHMEYNGQIYIVSNDGADLPTFAAHVSSYDGSDIVPIAKLPHSFMAKSIEQYGGRVYIGGTGTDINGGEHYAELYELTGNSLRLVRSFSPETRRSDFNSGDWPTTINDMTVHEGLLWFTQLGKKVVGYDQTSDAFYGGPAISSNADLDFQRIVSGRGRLWAWGIDPGTDANHGIYRIAQPADGVTTSPTWEPSIDTSDFHYEPGVKKRWGQMKIMTRYGPVSTLKYSLDSGTSWTSLSITNTSTYAPVYWCTAPLAAITPSENIRFRITLDTDTPNDAVTYHRELVAYTVQYQFLDTGKRAWSLSINGAEVVETKDAEFDESITQTQDTGDMDAQFDTWAFDKTPLTYTDVDGATYEAHIIGYTRSKPVIAPNPTGETHSESHHIVQLVEV